jgi:branched-subunit amino acid ABC-type transport system permease component
VAALLTALFLGTVVGSIYSLSAFGLVLTYRASGVFNFAHGAIAMLFAFVFYQLVQGGEVSFIRFEYTQTWKLPTGVALIVVVGILAPAFGALLDRLFFGRLHDAGEVVKIVVTIGLLVTLLGVVGVVWGGTATTLSPTSIFSPESLVVGGFRASYEQLASIGLTVAFAVGLLALLRYTPLGIRMRAVVDRPDVAELSGIDARRVSMISWAIGSSFAALSGILLAPLFGSLDPTKLIFFVVAASAAAIAGRLQSFPLTLAGGVGIGIAQLIVQRYAPSEVSRQLGPSIPFAVLFGLLFLPQWQRRPTDRLTPPPLPPVGRPLSPRDAATRVGIVGAIALVAPWVVGAEWHLQLARVPAMALIFLSLVVVSGFGGQVSLCQGALAGFGALITAHLVADAGVPFFLAVLIGGFAAVPMGVFLAFRAANLSPLFLGFATFAFGAVTDEVIFGSGAFSGGFSGIRFGRASILSSPRAYYIAVLAIFGIFALFVQNLRRSKTGLALGAMRESEVGLAALGVDVARLKIIAFSLSALIAGVGGALLSGADEIATPFSYYKFQSLLFLTLAVVGGIGNWLGAFVGAVIFQLLPAFVHEPFVRDNAVTTFLLRDQLEALLPIFFGLGAIGLARNPHGLVDQIRGWFAPRERQLVVSEPAPKPIRRARLVTFPRATLYHHPDCILAANKKGRVIAKPRVGKRQPCPVCQP